MFSNRLNKTYYKVLSYLKGSHKNNIWYCMTWVNNSLTLYIQDANRCDDEIRELREGQSDLSGQLEERQLTVQQLQSTTDSLDGDIERLLEHKHKVCTLLQITA